MKHLRKLFSIMVIIFTLSACSEDSSTNTNTGTLRIKAKATYNNAAARSANEIVLTSFKINISKIEFELADMERGSNDNHGDNHDDRFNSNKDSWDDDGFFDGDDATELQGPWELDLLNKTEPLTTVAIPNGTYEEVEFKLSPSLVTTSPIFGKTIEIRGTINGTPFVFWHNFDQKFEIDYEDADQNLVINNGSYNLVFDFDLNKIINTVEFSLAMDGNGNGLIEIGPNDTDGNNALANALHNHFKEGCEMENEQD